ncbi:FtsX-like permease family protein [Micromonospora sp. NPDC005979]|uniref:FtsX-like permease family protein n=1 Tax=Micromonospora sp. NPDC005979 TaxID=3156726 RepID=UPI0033B9FC4A
MTGLALRLLRQRPASAIATLVALAGGVMILMTLAVFIQSALVFRPAPEQFAAADVVVAHRELTVTTKEFGDTTTTRVPLPEGTVPVGLADEIRAVPGVTDVRLVGAEGGVASAVEVQAPTDAYGAIDRIARQAGVESYTGMDRGWAEQSDSIEARSFLLEAGSAFGGYVVLLIVVVAAGTIGLSVRHRRRDLALLRAVAATPRQARLLVVAEGVVVALASAVLGVPAGLWSTRWVHHQLVTRGFLPVDFPIVNAGLAASAAVALTVLVAASGAWIASRRIARIRPAEALGEAAVEPTRGGRIRLVSGLVTMAGGVASLFFAAGLSGTAALATAAGMLYLLVLAVALLAPWINGFAARLISPVLRAVWRAPGELAAANLRVNARGMSVVLSALVLAIGFGGSIWFLQDNLQRQTVTQSRDGMLADRVLTTPQGISSTEVAKVRQIPGVEAATGVRNTSVVVRVLDVAEPVVARAVDPSGLTSTIDVKVREGSLAGLTDGTIAASTLQASSSGWKVGETAEIWLADGTAVHPRVVATYDRGLGFGDVLLPQERGVYDEMLVRTTGDVDQRLAAFGTVTDTGTVTGQLNRDLAISAWLNKLLITVLVGYSALAAGNTMVMAALARSRELAVLRLAGVTRRQVRRMVHAEQVGLLGTALTLGAAIAGMTLVAVVHALTGTLIPYVPPLGWAAVLGGATALALVTTILPVRRLLRTPPVRAAGAKE